VRGLSPAYFAMVMATGIISTGTYLFGLRLIALALFWLNILVFVVLWILILLRLVWFRRAVIDDLTDHERGPGFFTAVAGACILGSQFIVISGNITAAIVLWSVAIVLWLGLTYSIFAALTIRKDKPPLAKGISGAWLLSVVATESIAVLTALIAAHWQQPYKLEANFFALSMWLWGGMLYIWMISLIFYRYTFFEFSPGDLSPPYWINMGAMAISTLAGSLLIMNASDAPFLQSILPFMKGFTVLYWATGTWWIPMLLILAIWRYVYRKFPLRYDPLYWGAVFPLGMYAVCSYRMAEALRLSFLSFLPTIFLYIALVTWAAAFLGLLYTLARRMLRFGVPAAN
jgi:tellurite resistance protein TehA-like permease